MVVECLLLRVGHELKRLEVFSGDIEALEVQSAGLDAPDNWPALDTGRLRGAGVVDSRIARAGGGQGGGKRARTALV